MSQTNGDFYTGATQTPPDGLPIQTESGLAEILQSACPAGQTGQITFRSENSYGFVFLQQGQVIHAACENVEGDEAVYQMLAWAPGVYALNEDILPHTRTITLTWEQLLFEGARRAEVGAVTPQNMEPIPTTTPTTAVRAKDSLPKLIISQGEAPPSTVELHQEYTYLGRADENELAIPEASISSRHCVFILSGADVIVRDLNSSNGTYVNGEPVPEAILRPGDNIQVGVIDIKFVPGVRRPKLSPTQPVPVKAKARSVLNESGTTLKLPESYQRRRDPLSVIDDSQKDKAFVSGSSAISYDQLAPDAPKPTTGHGKLIIVLVLLIVLTILGATAYFVLLKH